MLPHETLAAAALPLGGMRHRRLATIGAAAALAAGALLSAGSAVRSADWAERFTQAPDMSPAHDADRTRPRLEAAAAALMIASFDPRRSGPRDGTDAGEAATKLGARIVPARFTDRTRPTDRERRSDEPVVTLVPRGDGADRNAPVTPDGDARPRSMQAAARPAASPVDPARATTLRAAPTSLRMSAANVPLPPRRPAPAPVPVAANATETAPAQVPAERAPVDVTAPASAEARAGDPEEPAATAGILGTPLAVSAVEALPPAQASSLSAPVAAAPNPPVASSAATARRTRALLPEVVGIGPAFAEELPPPPPPLPGQSEIVRLVRTLSALQDDMARGSGAALNAQTVLMRTIADAFTRADPSVWSEAHNARSLALYALSGGSPEVVRNVVAGGTLNAAFEPMVAGALGFLEGRTEDARRHFGTVDPAALDPSLEGPFFLAHAALRVEGDAAAALRDLDAARHASPGSLVEEAALRRAILIAAETNDVTRFDRLVNRYLRRFRESLYAGNFRRRLAAAVTRMTFIKDAGAFDRLDEVLAPMTPAGRQELYLLVSRSALENGSREAAALAAERAAATAEDGGLDAVRARLYRAAAMVVDPDETDSALDTLHALREESLPADDAALLSAALELGAAVTHMPAFAAEAVDPETAEMTAGAGAADSWQPERTLPEQRPPEPDLLDEEIVAAVETRAGALLDAVDTLLAKSGGQP